MSKKVKFVRVEAHSKAEAIAQVNNFVVKFDATTAFRNENEPKGEELDAFAVEYLQRKIKGIEGVGCIVTLAAGTADTRERPYKVENVITNGARKWAMTYHGYVGADNKGLNGKLVLSRDTKSEAEQAAKDYVTENRVNVKVVVGKKVVQGQAVAMEVKYTPSANTTLGSYLLFGYELEA